MVRQTARLSCGVIVVLAAANRSEAGADVVLVRNGRPGATLVVARQPTRVARLAALEIQFHVRKITGAALPIVSDDAAVKGTRVLVGDSAATAALGLRSRDFEPQEYLIAYRPGTVVLVGRDGDERGELDYQTGKGFPTLFDPQGTMYATYDFLERACGVRWYLPTDLGITYTARPTLTVGGPDVRRRPHMTYRYNHPSFAYPDDLCGDTVERAKPFGALARREQMLFLHRHRMGGRAHAVNHSFYGYYKRFWDTPPRRARWFAQGYPPTPPQMCYTHPAFIQQVIADARDYFDGKGKKPGAQAAGDYFGLVPMDNSSWCKCSACQALLPKEGDRGKGLFSNDRASNYEFRFVNAVARAIRKSHPDKWLSTIAYAQYTYPPIGEKVEPNVDVTLCLHTRYWWNAKIRDNDLAILKAWGTTGNPLSLWMYYCFPSLSAVQGKYRAFPAFFAHHIARQNAIFRANGVRGMKYEPSYLVNSRQSPLLDQLEFYVTWRLADNPNQDADKMIDAFFTRYYGAAARPMKAFYEKVERTYWNPASHPKGVNGAELHWKYLGTESVMAELGRYMEQAKAAVRTDLQKRRVALFDKGIWQYMVKGREAYWKYARLPLGSVAIPRVAPVPGADAKAVDWAKGGVLTGWRNMNGQETAKQVEGRLVHDGTHLYVRLVDRMDPAKLVDREGSVWNSDEYELFFAPKRARPYHQIGIHFKGHYEALRHGSGRMKPWDSGVRVISDTSAADRWTLYVVLPLAKLVPGGLTPGQTFYLNVVRSMKCNDAIAWSATLGGYHAPTRFGQATLAK